VLKWAESNCDYARASVNGGAVSITNDWIYYDFPNLEQIFPEMGNRGAGWSCLLVGPLRRINSSLTKVNLGNSPPKHGKSRFFTFWLDSPATLGCCLAPAFTIRSSKKALIGLALRVPAQRPETPASNGLLPVFFSRFSVFVTGQACVSTGLPTINRQTLFWKPKFVRHDRKKPANRLHEKIDEKPREQGSSRLTNTTRHRQCSRWLVLRHLCAACNFEWR
jgi:hypothetical protein